MIGSGFLIVMSEMLIPKFIQHYMDEVLPERNVKEFGLVTASLLAVLIGMFVAMAINHYIKISLREKPSRDLQHAVFSHLDHLGFSYYERNPAGDTLSLVNHDVSYVQGVYTEHLPQIVQQLFFLCIPLAFLIVIDLRLTLYVIPCYFLYYLVGPFIDKQTSRYLVKQTEALTAMNKKMYDTVASVAEVRALGATEWELGRFGAASYHFIRVRVISLLYRHLRFTFRQMANGVGLLIFYMVGSKMVSEGQMTIGAFVSFSIYSVTVMLTIGRITISFLEQTYILQQAGRLYRLLLLKPVLSDPPSPVILNDVRGELILSRVRFAYPEREEVLRGVSLHVRPGEKVALVGTSGGGKTTLLKLIPRFLDPGSGEIQLDGVPVHQLSLKQLRESIGYVFQETYLFGGTIHDNIRLGRPEATDEEVVEAARSACVHEFIMQLEKGYNTEVGERGIRLSGGQKQRIAIARMFLKQPAIVLLDEATASLDNENERLLIQALDRLLAGRTTIAIAHRLSTIRHYDRIIVLDQGCIAESGSYTELIQREGLFYQLEKGRDTA